MTPLQTNVLNRAQSQIGVQEIPKGSNAGPEVEIYLKSVGLGKGYAWCMAFVYWCVNEEAKKLKVPNPLVKTAGVLKQWQSLPDNMKKIKATPEVGDVFIMKLGKKGNGHTGFVFGIEDGVIHTIEGNTNADGSREGYEVCSHVRTLESITGFISIRC